MSPEAIANTSPSRRVFTRWSDSAAPVMSVAQLWRQRRSMPSPSKRQRIEAAAAVTVATAAAVAAVAAVVVVEIATGRRW